MANDARDIETGGDELLEGLNDAQRAAVTHGEGPLLIVAGAGTGKTTVLTRRYAWLLKNGERQTANDKREKGLTPENILALTFTEKAAGEMEDRILQMLPNGTYDFWISTFHGFCQRVLEERGLEIGLSNRFTVLSETDGWLLLKRRLTELPLNHYRPLGNPVKFLSALQRHISRAKDENVSPEEYLAFAIGAVLDGDTEVVETERARLKELADLAFAYRKMLRDGSCLDFGDLIQETLRLFRERPGVLEEYRARFPYVLVDEFQDTNWAQYELIKLLAGAGSESRSSAPRALHPANLTVVGDDDQAIYKFRGASLANILQFRDDYPDAKTVYLTQNYRSRQEILNLAHGFVSKNNPNRLEVKLADTGLSKRLFAARGDGASISVIWYPSVEDEAVGVAERIRELKAADADLTWNDVAVLVRSNDGAEPFVRALETFGIPFRFYALKGLYVKPLILDLVSVLSLTQDPSDSAAVWRVLHAPSVDFGADDAAVLTFYANKLRGLRLWDVCLEADAIPAVSEAGKKKIKKVVQWVERLGADARRQPPLRVLQTAIEQTGILEHVLSLPEGEKREQIEWLNKFANRVKRYETGTVGPTLKGFLEELRLEIDSGEEGALKMDPDEGPDLVKVLTVHASKGLEFRYVFIVSMVDQRFPTRKRPDSIPLPDGLVKERLTTGDAHLEEERRLFYVALTRAKDSVMLTGASDYGGTRAKKPSPFIMEAGLDVHENVRAAGVPRIHAFHVCTRPAESIEDVRRLYSLKRRFSYTQLAAFRSCPFQYKFAHVYRIPILGSYQKTFGQCMHVTLQDILELHMNRKENRQEDLFGWAGNVAAPLSGFRVTRDEAVGMFKERWRDEWYPDRDTHNDYYTEGLKATIAFQEACEKQVPPVSALEQRFDWHLGTHSIKGAIDRIDTLPDGSLALFDYKTGRPKEVLDSEDKEQLRIYQLAMEDRGSRVSRLALVFVRGMVLREVDLLAGEEKDRFRQMIAERMDDILASDFPPNASPFVCRFCDFRNICEFRKLK